MADESAVDTGQMASVPTKLPLDGAIGEPYDAYIRLQGWEPSPSYDYAGYIKKYGGLPYRTMGHLTDEFKTPLHPTFSTDSIYSTPETPGGDWKKEKDGKWHFYPSDFVLRTQGGPEKLKKYFDDYDKDSVLHLPKAKKK